MIEGNVQLAEDVQVGPWCRIVGDVTLGPGCVLHERVSMHGMLKAGANNEFHPGTVIGGPPQDRKFDPVRQVHGVAIGDRNIFRENVTIHRATGDHATTVGSDNFLMVGAHVGHDSVVGNHTTLANCVAIAGHVHIADNVTIGGNSGVHQFCRVGRLAMMAGVIAVKKDVPPFCTAYNIWSVGSLNIVGLRRAGYRQHIKPLKEAFRLLMCSRLPRPVAVQRILHELGDDPLCREFAEFAAASKRGISRYDGRLVEDESE